MQSEKLEKTISFSVDPFIAVYADSNPFWTIHLEDGRKIYQDDERPDLEKSAWIRAKKYIDANDLEISRVTYRYSGYEHEAYNKERDKNFDGFYFAKGCGALMSANTTVEHKFYVAGKVSGGEMYVERYEIPFLEVLECYKRPVEEKNFQSIVFKRSMR